MSLTGKGWKNKGGTSERSCNCGSWKQHWINYSGQDWPIYCSVAGCSNGATLGAHIYNPDESGEWIVPMCASCNNHTYQFSLKDGVVLVSANKDKTCG